jgi:site-specific recombinase XerC
MMKPLEYDLVQLCERYDQGGSYARRSDRKRDLRLMAKQLDKMGFKTMRARDLGGRHVNRLVALWAEQGLSVGTMKNRMGSLRWWAATLGRAHVMARRNETYGIPSRPIPNASRAVELTDDLLQAIDGPFCERIRVSLQLQRYLGLRMEESLKIRLAHAIVRDENGVIVRLDLRGSWCKSGRTRSILSARSEKVVRKVRSR